MMTISTNNAASLVGGSILAKGKTMKIQVTREFRIGGITQKMGKVLEVEKILGIELISANKAVQVLPADKKTDDKTPDKMEG